MKQKFEGKSSGKIAFSLLIVGFPLLHLVALSTASLSFRRIVIYMSSFSFHTNLLGWIFVLTGNQLLGHYTSRYLMLVAGVWFTMLGGREESLMEYGFNSILHYCLPIATALHYYADLKPTHLHKHRLQWILGYVYPILYASAIYYVSPLLLTYRFYQPLFEQWFQVVIVACITECLAISLETV